MVTLSPPKHKTRKLHPTRALERELKQLKFERFDVKNRRGTQLFDVEFWGDLENPKAPTIWTAAEFARRIRQDLLGYKVVELGEDVIAEHRPNKPIILTSLVLERKPLDDDFEA